MIAKVQIVDVSDDLLRSPAVQSLLGPITRAQFQDSAKLGGIHRCIVVGTEVVGTVNVSWQRELAVAVAASHRRCGVGREACRLALDEAFAVTKTAVWAKTRIRSDGELLARSLGFVERSRTATEVFFTYEAPRP